MQRVNPPALLLLLLLTFAFSAVGAQQRPSGTYQVRWEGGLKLNMSDGAILGADGYIPVPRDNATRFPVLVFPNSWGMPTFEYIVKTLNYADTGYIAIEYETRGWYSSGGEIDVAGPRDLLDAATVLDYVASRQDWFPDLDNMAFVGISYGAGIALSMAGSDPRVKTSVVMSGWANITDAMLPYNTPNKVWGGALVLLADLLGKPSPQLQELYNDVLQHNNLTFVSDFCAVRSPLRFLETLNARNTPLFFSHNRLDRLFRSDLALDFYAMLNTTNKFLMVNVGVHAEPEAFGLIDLGTNKIWVNARQWLDHYLMGRETDITQLPPVQMQVGDTITAQTYVGFKSWPDATIEEQQFIFNPRGGNHFASMTQVSSGAHAVANLRDGARGSDETISYSILPGLTPGVAIITGLIRSLGIPYDTEILLTPTETAMIYRSEPLSETTRYCGVPKLNLTVVANQPNWQVYAFLYDIDAVDVAYLVANTYYTQYGSVVGTPTQLIDLHFHQTCRDFPSGHRIGVGVVLFCDLYQPAATDGLKVTFQYGGFAASLTMPKVQN